MRKYRLPSWKPDILALAAIFILGQAFCAAFADETPPFPCGPLDKAQQFAKATGGGDFVVLSNDQWQFVRGLFVMAPDTPPSLPPGDRAEMSLRPDGSASIIFVDDNRACAPIRLGPEAVKVIMQVGRGDLVHAERGL